MFENMEKIKIIFASSRIRVKKIRNNRKNHALIYRTSGCGIHKFDKKTILSPKGSILFVPAGSSYCFEPMENEICSSISISFIADIKNPKPALYNGDNLPGIDNVFMSILKNFTLHTAYSNHMCLSLLHTIFAYLVVQDEQKYSDKRKTKLIEPAINYINTNLYDPLLKTDILHSLCHISPTYFNEIFKSYFGTTPQKYIEEKRLEFALSLLKESTYSISEISKMSGYNDPLYFSKVFKKKYGISPSYLYKGYILF